MSSIIAKKEEYILTRAQFEKLKKDNKLVIGSVYKIKDDPTAQALIDGIFTSKKAEQDSNGNVIYTTYRRLDDSYSITDIDNQFISKLANYYTKQETYTKSEVDILLNAIPKFGVQVITELPTTNISTTVIYLLAQEAKGSDYYDEYMYINNQWELIGSTRIDLSNYYTIVQVEERLTTKVSITDEANQIYGTNAIGEPDTYTISDNASVDTIAKRTSTGTLKINDATEINEAASYGQLQSLLIDETNARSQADTEIKALIPTKVSQLSNDSNYVIDSTLALVAKTGSYTDLTNLPDISGLESRINTIEDKPFNDYIIQENFNKLINNETVLQRRSNGSFYLGTNLTSISDAAKNNTIIGNNSLDRNILPINTVYIGSATNGAKGSNAVIIGANAWCNADNNIVIGNNATVISGNYLIQLGDGRNSTSYTLQIFDDNIYNWNTHTLTVQNILLNGVDINTVISNAIPSNISDLANDSGYLTSFTEEDPTVGSHIKAITEQDISNWNNKLDSIGLSNYYLKTETYSQNEINSLIEQNKFSGSYNDLTNTPTIPSIEGLATETYVNNKVASLVDSAPETLDTLAEVATAIQENETVVEALNGAIGNKADKSEITTLDGRVETLENKTPSKLTLYVKANWAEGTDGKVTSNTWDTRLEYDTTTTATWSINNGEDVLKSAHNNLVDRVAVLETSIPTKMSDLTNDTEYVTKAEMEAAIAEAIKNLVTAEQLEAAITNNITDTLNTEV